MIIQIPATQGKRAIRKALKPLLSEPETWARDEAGRQMKEQIEARICEQCKKKITGTARLLSEGLFCWKCADARLVKSQRWCKKCQAYVDDKHDIEHRKHRTNKKKDQWPDSNARLCAVCNSLTEEDELVQVYDGQYICDICFQWEIDASKKMDRHE